MRIAKRIGCAALVAAAIAMVGAARASDWPARQVTVIVPLAAGGNTDLMARLGSEALAAKLGQAFVVENHPSAGGALATGQVAAAMPDGYTILFAPDSMVLLTPLVQKLNFDPDGQLVPITNMGTGTQVIAVRRDLPVTTLPEFIAYAKANPGKLNFTVAGTNNISHLGPVLLFKRTGLELTMVPARGEPQAISDLMAGTVDFYFGNSSVLLQYADHPKVRLLATGAAARLAVAPDLPTIAETVPGFEFASWNGFLAPVGTPEEIISKVRTEITALVKSPAMTKRLTNLGIVPGGQSKEEVEAVFRHDRQAFAEAVKAAGIPAP